MSRDQQSAAGYSQNDRVAHRDSSKCAAYGCPMHGTMTSSTLGTSEWLCWLHFRAESAQWQRITAELHRLSWLVEAIAELRRTYTRIRTAEWDAAYLGTLKTIRLYQRSDLEIGKDETVLKWLGRLDNALSEACREAEKDMPVRQQKAPADTWQKVSFQQPGTA